MAIKAIVMDIDGTLLTSEKRFHQNATSISRCTKARPITDFGFWPPD